MHIIIKVIAIILAGVSISKSYLDYRKKLEPPVMFFFWTIVWLGATVLLVFPSLIDAIIASTRATITIGALMSLALVFMLFIVYRIYTKASRIEYQQRELIRKMALLEGIKQKRK
jgi:hypothetical protein